MSEAVEYERIGNIAVLAANNPPVNALGVDVRRGLLAGIERADSIAMDAHKWLFQPFEAGCLMVKDVRKLESAFSVRPEYLQDTEWGRDHPNFGDRGLQLSRSFRALKVWLALRAAGRSGYEAVIRGDIELAQHLYERAEEHPELRALYVKAFFWKESCLLQLVAFLPSFSP